MKRLMYTQLLYDSAYFAFEGQWTYASNTNKTGITPIGRMQQQAKKFFSSLTTPDLGTHVATIGIMLDFYGGWARPCDNMHGGYSAKAWGNVAWDSADYFADAVFDVVFPGYRGGAMNHDEKYYLSPTPYGDSIDTVLNDALPSVLAAYHTLVIAHRMTAEPTETARKLFGFVQSGGQLVISASSVTDLGGTFAGISVGKCETLPAGASVIVGAEAVIEPMALELCELTTPANATVLATSGGKTVATRVAVAGGGSVVMLAHGNYAMSTRARTSDIFKCGIDDDPHADRQPYQLARAGRKLIDEALRKAALFDLGLNLSWVVKRVSDTEHIIGVSNNDLHQLPLNITSQSKSSLLGAVTKVEELLLDQSEKLAEGYLPHGFENASLGKSTTSTIAGADMRIFRVTTSFRTAHKQTVLGVSGVEHSSVREAPRVLLRLSRISSIRTEIERRPSFFNYFSGVVIDSEYLSSRSRRALMLENRWLGLQHVMVVCDFTRSTNLFPGLRLVNDISAYFNESMVIIEDVLDKLPLLQSQHAILTLHGSAELAPVGACSTASGQEHGANWTACFRLTLQRLTARAAARNATLHLRQSPRNNDAAGSSLEKQVGFAASVNGSMHFKIAPSSGLGTAAELHEMASLFKDGAAEILLLSAAASAPLEELPLAQRPSVQTVARVASASDAILVLDAGLASDGVARRDVELSDSHLLRSMLS